MPALEPTRYHVKLRDAVRALEPGLFRWFSSDELADKRADLIRLELLRSCYRLSPESNPRPHELAAQAAEAIGLDVPVHLYQLHHATHANAGMYFVAGEAHVVISGPLLDTLDDAELRYILGHELAHHRLWTLEDGSFRATAELVSQSGAKGASAHAQSAMRGRRWTEIFADRGGLVACGDRDAALRGMVKVATGLSNVSADDYLAQAREVVERLRAHPESPEGSHPEDAVRAVALAIWAERGDEADDDAGEDALAPLVNGARSLETLDLIEQRELGAGTRTLIDRILAPTWIGTDAVRTHAARYFPATPDADRGAPPLAPSEITRLARSTPALADYFAYVLLDFAVVDPDLGELALAHVACVASELELADTFSSVARKELKLTVAALKKLVAEGPALFEAAARQASSEGESA